ncbi:MAG: VWA domain-containing protein, partial [Acidobacteriota bacterium]|nr:VWA domain-containing protein [Acidobacteriota bacterium]
MNVHRPNSFVATIVAALALAALPAGAQEPVRPEAELTEDVEVRLQTARLRIEPTQDAEPGECLGMDITDLKVSLRGERVTDPGDIRLERERRPTLHALLIDTSGSMRGKLHHVRRAASGYVRGLDPEFDRGLVASFDESLLLMTGATADREALLQGIKSVRMSGSTTLNDGLYYIIRELDGHLERPVILLLSDGVDTASLYDSWDVLDLIESREDLSVFVIGLNLPMIGDLPG